MTDLQAMWKLLTDSNAGQMQFKLYKTEGDKKPFRLILLVDGEDEVADVMAALEALDQARSGE